MAKRRRRRNRTAYITRPYSQKQLLALARKLTESMLAPEQRRLESEGARRGQAITGFTGALSGVLGDIAPKVQAGYQGAARDTAAFSKGYSDGLAQLQGGVAEENNALLGTLGAPEGQMQAPGTALADVLYGTAGAIPGASLEREGAAFGAAASMLPAQAAGRGQQELVRSQYDYNAQLAELAKRRPELMREIMNELVQHELAKYGASINAGYLQNAQAQTAIDAFSAQADAAADAKAGKGKAGKAKQDLWDKKRDKAFDRALALGEGKPNPSYNPQLPPGPQNPETIPYTWASAFDLLWNFVGKELVRRGFRKAKVTTMLGDAMRAANIKQPTQPGGHL
jgi:hypothetical protein